MARTIGLGTGLAALWLLLSGHYTPLLLSFGAVSVVLIVYLARRMDVIDHEGVPYFSVRLLLYVPWLLKETFIANVKVARLILNPTMPISPIMVRFMASQKSDIGRVIYANSITLTPGTITTGVNGNEFEIHALTFADVDGTEEGEMDRRCTWLEDGFDIPEAAN